MTTFRLRSQLFVAALLIILGLTGSLLYFIRHTVDSEIQKQVKDGTDASGRALERFQREREPQLSRMGAMLGDLPTMKALMSTQHAPTIQDGSESFWKLAESDLLVLAKPNGNIVALHMTKPGWSIQTVEGDLKRSTDAGEDASWWYDDGRLYWIFLHPITSGAGPTMQPLGFLAVGYQVDSAVAQQLSVAAQNQIALATNNTVIASTLPGRDTAELQRRMRSGAFSSTSASGDIALDTDQYAYSSVLLHGSSPVPVRCYVMMPLVPVNSFIKRLNYSIYVAGGLAVLFGMILFGFVARTITHPLDNLVAGVRALAAGDYTYTITPRGSSEAVELAESFSKMRGELLAFQQKQIETERVAAVGRAANSISHDLRHHLAALVANAEFLYEAEKLKLDRNEIYDEIRAASEQITELLDSLRDLADERRTITPVPASIDQTIRRAIEAVQGRPELRSRSILMTTTGDMAGGFASQVN